MAYPYSSSTYQGTQFFPQPQGNVYIINNSMEIANIPVSGGISVAICPNESLMYIKSMQNGAPTLLAYNLTPCETKTESTSNDRIQALEKEVENLKKMIGNGGKLNNEL